MKRTQWFAVITASLMMMACGKSMSLRVQGSALNQGSPEISNSIDASKLSQTSTLLESENLKAFSEFDSKNHHFTEIDQSTLSRVTVQIPPQDAVQEVVSFKLELKGVRKIEGVETLQLCIEKAAESVSCQKITAESVESSMVLDLESLFGLDVKTDAEIMDWISLHSTEFASPGYRKLRLKLDGLLIDSGSLILQVITNEKLPKGYAVAPSQIVNGDADLR